MKIITSENYTIYVGQNMQENDKLFKDPRISGDSLWFHLDDGPSAHVYMVFNDNYKFLKTDLKQASQLVRQYSKNQTKTKVIYLPKRNLKLISNGLVELLQEPKKI